MTHDAFDLHMPWWILLDEWMFRHGDECDCPKAAHHAPLCHVTPIYASVCGDHGDPHFIFTWAHNSWILAGQYTEQRARLWHSN